MSPKNRELISTGKRLVELLIDIRMICEWAESRIEKLPGWESRLCNDLRELLKARWRFRNMLGNDPYERLAGVCARNPNSYDPDTFNAPLVLWKVVEKVEQALWDAFEGSEFGPWSWDVQQNGTLPMELHPNTISRFTIRALEALAPIDLDRLERSAEAQLALLGEAEKGHTDMGDKNPADSADTGADNSKKIRPTKKPIPDDPVFKELLNRLVKELPDSGKSENQIAIEVAKGDRKKAASLLRKLRRYDGAKGLVNSARQK